MKTFKRLLFSGMGLTLLLILSGCVQTNKQGQPTGQGFVYQFLVAPMSQVIKYFASDLGLGFGLAIILVTVIVRLIILPLGLYQSWNATYQSEKRNYLSPDLLRDLADSKTPQGIVAEVRLQQEVLPEKLSGKYLFLEDVQDPGNLGTIIRTADAAGFDGIFISEHSADLYNLKTLRSMQGSHFHLPIYRLATANLIDLAKKSDLPILASTLSDDSIDYQKLKGSKNFILVMGNEGQGISSMIEAAADQLVHIPMKGKAESLNVAVAAGILIFYLS